jgi:hypothetical protein
MPGASAFGPLVAASDMEDAVLAQLQAWLPDYLAEVERTHGLQVGSLPQPRSWVLSSEVERFPEEQLPAVMLASPGLTDPPLADGTGVYTARWQLVVDERYRLLDSIDDRTTCVAEVEVAVEVAAVLSRQAGPLEPLLPPGSSQGPDSPTWPVALTADVAVTKTEE